LESTKPVSGEIKIDASNFETSRLLFFDRFSVHRGPRFMEIHFGYYGHSKELQKGLVVIVSRQSLEEQKANLMQYLQQIGMPEPSDLPECSLRSEADVISADIIGMARHGDAMAEISFHTFSWKVIVEKVRSAEAAAPVQATCAALLRCDVDLQKRLILDLYEDENQPSQGAAS
jgi:hypothetical protein